MKNEFDSFGEQLQKALGGYQIIKVRYYKNGDPSGKLYTYECETEYEYNSFLKCYGDSIEIFRVE
jgi:hypothetical protein